VERHAIPDRPFALWNGLTVPVGHVEPLQRLSLRRRPGRLGAMSIVDKIFRIDFHRGLVVRRLPSPGEHFALQAFALLADILPLLRRRLGVAGRSCP
jgi:hypothetical protein